MDPLSFIFSLFIQSVQNPSLFRPAPSQNSPTLSFPPSQHQAAPPARTMDPGDDSSPSTLEKYGAQGADLCYGKKTTSRVGCLSLSQSKQWGPVGKGRRKLWGGRVVGDCLKGFKIDVPECCSLPVSPRLSTLSPFPLTPLGLLPPDFLFSSFVLSSSCLF